MSRGYPMGGGGGADTSIVTATAANVEVGKVIVDKDGNPLNGTLRNVTTDSVIDHASDNTTPVVLGDEAFISTNSDGQIRAEIRFNGTRGVVEPNTLFAVPQGTMATVGGLTAAKLAQGQEAFGIVGTYKGLGNAGQADVRAGKTFSTAALSNASGTMPEQGGSTITPRSYAQTAVAANRYVTGNVTVAGDANLVAGNIKKGVSIFGVQGTHSGYVPSASDLYLRGNNIVGFQGGYSWHKGDSGGHTSSPSFDAGQITLVSNWGIHANINFTGFTKLNIEINITDRPDYDAHIYMKDLTNTSVEALPTLANVLVDRDSIVLNSSKVYSIDVTTLQITRHVGIESSRLADGAIYRIWLS